MHPKTCTHLAGFTAETVRPERVHQCDECVKTGDRWLHLRTCQTCGTTLCCDSSPNQHATKHFRASQHPVVASAEPGEYWLWCYADEQIREY
jgi:uncharacterized UBP type Zn finger protein